MASAVRTGRRRAAYGLLALAFSGASWLNGAGNYLVEGIVVDSRSHAPVANALVSLALSKARDQKTEHTTKQDGRFSFSVSLEGKYSLKIRKAGYPSQDYKQAGFSNVETAIVVREDQDNRHIVFEARRGGAIAGLIKDEDSEPVGRALVAIFQSVILNGERKIVARGQARANAVGEFRFRNLPPGNYYVCAMGRPWFADSLIQLQAIREYPPFSRRTPAQLESTVQTAPTSDEQPVEPEEPLPPYSPAPDFRGTAFVTTFFPNAPTVEGASLVRVEAGGEAQASIALPLTRASSIKGAIGVAGEMSGGRVILSKKIYDKYMPFLEGWAANDGKFQFSNVPAGSYEIVAASQANSGPSSWNLRQEVEVGTSDMEIQLRPLQMSSFSGHVLFDSEPPSSATGLFVSLRNDRGELNRAEVAPDGGFSFNRLSAGRYEIIAGSADYIAAYLKDPAGGYLPLSLEITSGSAVRHDLVLTGALSVIDGTVERAGLPQVGAFVLLMPKNQSEHWAYRVDQTDSDGSYHLATIPPGDYFLIANGVPIDGGATVLVTENSTVDQVVNAGSFTSTKRWTLGLSCSHDVAEPGPGHWTVTQGNVVVIKKGPIS